MSPHRVHDQNGFPSFEESVRATEIAGIDLVEHLCLVHPAFLVVADNNSGVHFLFDGRLTFEDHHRG